MKQFLPGQHLTTERPFFVHHGIYVGEDTVMHYVGEGIVLANLSEFAQGQPISCVDHPDIDLDKVLERAYSRLGEKRYGIFNNCESFCNWCCIGQNVSYQVRNTLWFILDIILN